MFHLLNRCRFFLVHLDYGRPKAYSLLFGVPNPKLLYPEPQKSMPSEMAAPDRHEPPLAKLQRTAPVAAFRAYMCPSGSREQPNTKPFAVLTGPEVLPPNGGLVCQSTAPVTASKPLQTPEVSPSVVGQGTLLLLALAVYTRLPSTAEPHCKPPAVPPGPPE